jgi:uncharacterized membrane protein YfcA
MDKLHLVLILIVGILTGSYATLVGGGALISIPILIFLGLPPQVAIGTSKLGAFGVNIAGWYKFHQKRLIDYKIGFVMGIPIIIGTVFGVNLVLQINEELLRRIIAILTLLFLIFIVIEPKMGVERTKPEIRGHKYLIGGALGLFLGVYSGFYGAGTGTFLNYILVLYFGQTFLESAATRKMPHVFSAVMGIIAFTLHGMVIYSLGIALFIGTFIGSYIGAHYSDRIGNVWIKRLFFLIVFIMGIKLLI